MQATLDDVLAEIRRTFNGQWGRLWARTSLPQTFRSFWQRSRVNLTPQAGEIILEVACGAGNLLVPLAAEHPQVQFLGIDLSEQMVALSTQYATTRGVQNVRFSVGDMTRLEVASASVDKVIISRAFGHYRVLDPIFDELSRVVKPGGLGIFITQVRVRGFYWAKYQFMAWLASQFSPKDKTFIDRYVENTPALETVIQDAEQSGFVIEEVIRKGFLACIVGRRKQSYPYVGGVTGEEYR